MPRKAHHEEHENLEAWVIPYADLLTLLLAMFLALYATSNTDLAKLREFATAFRAEVGGGSSQVVDAGIKTGGEGDSVASTGGQGMLDGTGLSFAQQQAVSAIQAIVDSAGDAALQREAAAQTAAAADRSQLDEAQSEIQQALAGTGLEQQVQFRQTNRGLLVTVVTDGVLFSSGTADLAPQAGQLISGLGGALKGIDNEIEITGHTDSVGNDDANVLLSQQRAYSVYSYLTSKVGVAANRIRVSGMGASQPLADNSTAAGRAENRRVEITVLTKSLTADNSSTAANSLTAQADAPTGTPGTAAADAPADAGGNTP